MLYVHKVSLGTVLFFSENRSCVVEEDGTDG